MRRVNVIGTSCSGKSTFSRRLAEVMDVPHVELDHLHWEPGWIEVTDDVFRARVATALATDGWVVDGNYSVIRDVVWPNVDTFVWLNYPFPLVLFRSLKRTACRVIRREMCCNGNRESLWRSLSRDSIILWVIRTHHAKRKKYRTLMLEHQARGAKVIIFHSPRSARKWLNGLNVSTRA